MNEIKVIPENLPSSGPRLFCHIVKAVSFWAGITFPILYLPLLFSGLKNNFERVILFVLLLLHAMALFIGQTYDTDGK